MYDISEMEPNASLITPRLYLSNYMTAADMKYIREQGFTHVISVVESAPTFAPSVRTLHVAIEDSFFTDILSHLPQTTDFIREAMTVENSKVLVHCMMVSRGHSVDRAPILSAVVSRV